MTLVRTIQNDNNFNGTSSNNCSMKETIKKNFMSQMDKNSLTNIGDF